MDVFWAAFGGGAAAGVVALLGMVVVEVWRDRRDKPRLELDGRLGDVTPRGTFEPNVSTYFTVNAGNVGRRLVRIMGYGYQYKGTDKVIHCIPPRFAQDTVPCDLEPGHSFMGWILLDEMAKSLSREGCTAVDIRRVWVRDAVGRYYYGKVVGQESLAKEVSKREEETR